MGIGAIAIVTSQKKEPNNGPPFVATSAQNGDSVDATGKIVLGNDVGQVGAPAQLLNNREILMNFDPNTGQPFSVAFNDNQIALSQTVLSGGTIQQIATLGGFAIDTMEVATGGNADRYDINMFGTGTIDFATGLVGTLTFQSVQTANGFVQIGPPLQTFNTAALQVSGSFTHRAFVQGQTGVYNVDRDLDTAKLLTNSGAATYNLPNMSGALFRSGFTIRAATLNVAGIVFQAFVGQTIRFGAAASSVGGTLTSVTVGSTVRLVLVNQATWVTESFTGTWVTA